MKRLLVTGCMIIVAFCVAGIGTADLLTYGPMGGVNFSTFYGDDKGDASFRTGFSVGGFATIAILERLRVQPEAYISLLGAKYDSDAKTNLYYLSLPVLAKWYPGILPLNMNILGGPYFGFNFSSKNKVDGSKSDFDANTFDWGITLGLGLEIKNIIVDGRYSFGLTDVVDTGKLKNSYFQILAGYRFGTKEQKK
jgi:hypothetical protein